METTDLLLIIGVVLIGVAAMVYIIFVLGNRLQAEYVLQCPPCNGNSTTAQQQPQPLVDNPVTAEPTPDGSLINGQTAGLFNRTPMFLQRRKR